VLDIKLRHTRNHRGPRIQLLQQCHRNTSEDDVLGSSVRPGQVELQQDSRLSYPSLRVRLPDRQQAGLSCLDTELFRGSLINVTRMSQTEVTSWR
jgi:hypothetical protein